MKKPKKKVRISVGVKRPTEEKKQDAEEEDFQRQESGQNPFMPMECQESEQTPLVVDGEFGRAEDNISEEGKLEEIQENNPFGNA